MSQQARNLIWRLEAEGIELSAVIHDRDKKFAPAADMILLYRCSSGLTPLLAPKTNAHVEGWIGTCCRECIDWMLVVNLPHLEAIVREFCTHYNRERPHRTCQLRPPAARGDPTIAVQGDFQRRACLGGLLNETTAKLLPPDRARERSNNERMNGRTALSCRQESGSG